MISFGILTRVLKSFKQELWKEMDFFFLILKIYLKERERKREHEQGEGQREKEHLKQTPR